MYLHGVTHLQFDTQSLFSRSPNQHYYKKLTARTWWCLKSCWCLVSHAGGDWAGSGEVPYQQRGALGPCPGHGSEGEGFSLGWAFQGADGNE